MSYITQEGFSKLSQELDYLWKKKRPEVTQAVSEAAALGDRSENAEYIYGKKQLRDIDRRVRFLNKRLGELTIVSHRPSDLSRIYFGAYISLENQDGDRRIIRIVGSDEFDDDPQYISLRSPLARAIMGKSAGDSVTLNLEAGTIEYTILKVEYRTID